MCGKSPFIHMEYIERSKAPVVWLNMTFTANWNRPPCGIARVEYEICKEIINSARVFPVGVIKFEKLQVQQYVPPQLPVSQPLVKLSGFRKGDVLIDLGIDLDGKYTPLYPGLKNLGLHILMLCHDIIPILYPQYCTAPAIKPFERYIKNLCTGSTAVLSNSQRTRSDFLEFCRKHGYPLTDTTVVRLGDSLPADGTIENQNVASILGKKFILFVSTIERRKNHEVLYRAYHLLCAANKGDDLPLLVFVGMPGWGVRDLMSDILLDPLTKGKIQILEQVTDGELNALYRHCLFTVYPSLYEGWGLPVAEALLFGKAVITTKRGSLPEVGGDLADYVDPWDVSGWAEILEKYVRHPQLLAAKEQRIRSSYTPSCWGDAAQTVAEVATKLIHGKT